MLNSNTDALFEVLSSEQPEATDYVSYHKYISIIWLISKETEIMHHALIKNLLHYDTKKLRCEGGNDNLYFHRNQAIHMKSRLEYKKLYQNKCFIYVCFYVDMTERCQKSNFYREPLWYSNGKFIVFPFVCFHAVDIKQYQLPSTDWPVMFVQQTWQTIQKTWQHMRYQYIQNVFYFDKKLLGLLNCIPLTFELTFLWNCWKNLQVKTYKTVMSNFV